MGNPGCHCAFRRPRLLGGMIRAIACLAIVALPGIVFCQGKLDRVREEVDRPRQSTENKSADENPSTPDEDPGDEPDNPFSEVLLYAAITPWMLPNAMFDAGYKIEAQFEPYPYARPDTAHILLNRNGRPDFFDDSHTHWWSVRASGEVGSDFDGLTRTGLRLFLDTNARFGIKTDWDYYLERTPCGCYDDLWIGDITGTYRFAQNEWIEMHTGLGARLLLDQGGSRGGINFLYGFDYFPIEPAHVFASFEAGTLGTAGLIRFHGGIGLHWKHGEAFAGYDYLRIGGATLQGPFIGLRLWF